MTTRPYAADDFPMIRSRLEELLRERNRGTMTQPRVADDIATIRAPMEELRRERSELSADQKERLPIGPRSYHRATPSVMSWPVTLASQNSLPPLGPGVPALVRWMIVSKVDGIDDGIGRIIWIIGRPTSDELRLSGS